MKARTSAMISLKQVLVNAPAELREQLQPLTKMALIRRCAALRAADIVDPMTAAKHTLRAIAMRLPPDRRPVGELLVETADDSPTPSSMTSD